MAQVVQNAPDNAAYWYELGTDYGDSDSKKAEQACERAVLLSPKDVGYLLDLADRQAENGRNPEAEANYRRAMALAPDNSDALSRLGGFLIGVHSEASSQQEVEGMLKRATTLDPNNNFAWFGLGRLAMQRNDMKQAITCLERVVAENPDIADAWYALSRAYARLGDRARAALAVANSQKMRQDYLDRVHTQELLQLHPNDPDLHLKLARLSAKEGENARAILEYRLCLKQAPHPPVAQHELDALMAFLRAKGRMPSMTLYNIMVADISQNR